MCASSRLSNNPLQRLPVQFQDSQIELLWTNFARFEQQRCGGERVRRRAKYDLAHAQAPDARPVAKSGHELQRPADESATERESHHSHVARYVDSILDQNPVADFACNLPNLQSIIPDFVFRLSKLQTVFLNGNPQLQLNVRNQVSLSVNELHLAACNLTKAPMQLIEVMPELRVFNLSWNKITSLENASTSIASKVQVLDLDGNQLRNMLTVVNFAAASPSLTELRLASNNFTNCNLPSAQSPLEILDLSSNALEDCEIVLPKIRVLDLQGNQLRAVPRSILSLSNLDELYLTGNPIDPWVLTQDELLFFANLSEFRIQQSAFASCPIEDQQSLHEYKVCIRSVLSPLPIVTPPVAPNSTADDGGNTITSTRKGDKFQVVYIFASFVMALVIGAIVFKAMKRKRSRSNGDSSSPKSIACLGSPTGLSLRDNDDLAFLDIPYEVAQDEMSKSLSLDTASRSNFSVLSRSVFASSFKVPGGDNIWVDEELTTWRVDYDSVQLETCVSAGAFVEVWEATYRLDKVAVKKLRPSKRLFYHKYPAMVDPAIMSKFIMEIKVLSRLDHPRIVVFFGIAWKDESTILCVMEYMPQQDLRSFLQRQREDESGAAVLDQVWGIEKFHIALDVLEALAYIHTLDPVLVHCDLKSRNVLLDNTLQAKLSDFGISKYLGGGAGGPAGGDAAARNSPQEVENSGVDQEDVVMDEVRHLLSQTSGFIHWIAPEVLLAYNHYSEAVDIYAFGVLLCELDTLRLPYEDLRNKRDGKPISDASIRKRVAKGELKPRFSPNCPPEVLQIAMRCLSFDPSERPSALELIYFLRKAASTLLSKRSAEVLMARYSACSPSGASSTETDWSRRTIELKPDRRL